MGLLRLGSCSIQAVYIGCIGMRQRMNRWKGRRDNTYTVCYIRTVLSEEPDTSRRIHRIYVTRVGVQFSPTTHL